MALLGPNNGVPLAPRGAVSPANFQNDWEAISDEFELIKVIRVHENLIIERLQSRRSLNKTEKVT